MFTFANLASGSASSSFHRKAFIAYVYKIVSISREGTGRTLSFKRTVQNWLKRSLEDPIAKILAKGSNLTRTQLETLLIDALAENLTQRQLTYEEKAQLRQTKAKISRGSFNRTLRQAKENTIRSMYTLLLLGYLGVLEDTSLAPYLEISDKLKAYMNSYRDLLSTPDGATEQLHVISMLRKELESMLEDLSKPWTSSRP